MIFLGKFQARFSRLRRKLSSIQAGILFLALAISFIASFCISSFYYYNISREALEQDMDLLTMQSHIMRPQFESVFKNLRQDINVISELPPIQGIIRSVNNNGIDPVDNSSLEQWKARLASIFASMIENKRFYSQIHFVGVSGQGQEIVRVNYDGNTTVIASNENLHKEGKENYFQYALGLKPGEVFFSSVDLNRDEGRLQEPYVPVLRTILPVFGSDGEIFGMVSIVAAYDLLLEDVMDRLSPQEDLFIVNDTGDYILYRKGIGDTGYVMGKNLPGGLYNRIFYTLFHRGSSHGTIIYHADGREYLTHFHTLYFDESDVSHFLSYGLIKPKEAALEHAHKVRNQSLVLAFILILSSMACAWFMAKLFTQPLRQMIESVRAFETRKGCADFPKHRKDEIGELARAFDALTRRLGKVLQSESDALARLQTIVDNTADGLITVNGQGVIEYYNTACETIFGYSAGEAIGCHVSLLMPELFAQHKDGFLVAFDDEADHKGIIAKGQGLIGQRKDGRTFPLELSVSEVHMRGEPYYSGIIRDVSERRKAEEEILRSNEELERFAYVASHDLQEPVRIVSNFAELLKEEYDKNLDAQGRQYLGFIAESSRRLHDLVTDLLDYSRIGLDDQIFSRFDSNDQVDACLDYLAETIKELDATIEVKDLPSIHANQVRFFRLMQNLIGNALKYRSAGRKPHIIVSAQRREKDWLFSVEDNGIGIKSDYLDTIFIIFKRLHNSKEYGGTGIGLAVCKKIVKSFGGEIWAKSTYDKGSTFYFTVPEYEAQKDITKNTEGDNDNVCAA